MTREENKLRYERRADEAEQLAALLAMTEQQEAERRQPTKKEMEGGNNGAALSSSNEFSKRRGDGRGWRERTRGTGKQRGGWQVCVRTHEPRGRHTN